MGDQRGYSNEKLVRTLFTETPPNCHHSIEVKLICLILLTLIKPAPNCLFKSK